MAGAVTWALVERIGWPWAFVVEKTAAGTVAEVVIGWPWALVVVMGTATLVAAEDKTEVVSTMAELPEEDEMVIGTTMPELDDDSEEGGGGGPVDAFCSELDPERPDTVEAEEGKGVVPAPAVELVREDDEGKVLPVDAG